MATAGNPSSPGGWNWTRPTDDHSTPVFYSSPAILLVSAAMVVSARNPVHSVLFLILAFFNAAALFLIAGAEFLAMILVIVYVGAVAVLFLFVVMMLDVDFAELRSGFQRYLPVARPSAWCCCWNWRWCWAAGSWRRERCTCACRRHRPGCQQYRGARTGCSTPTTFSCSRRPA